MKDVPKDLIQNWKKIILETKCWKFFNKFSRERPHSNDLFSKGTYTKYATQYSFKWHKQRHCMVIQITNIDRHVQITKLKISRSRMKWNYKFYTQCALQCFLENMFFFHFFDFFNMRSVQRRADFRSCIADISLLLQREGP